jgi:hypothetical protein
VAQPAGRDEALPLLEQPLVVRRNPDVAAQVEQSLERLDEAGADRVEVAVGDLGALEVDALAEPNVRPQLRELGQVGRRPLQPGLQDDADVLLPGLAQLAVAPQRVVSR